jgi:hypothetical protein
MIQGRPSGFDPLQIFDAAFIQLLRAASRWASWSDIEVTNAVIAVAIG